MRMSRRAFLGTAGAGACAALGGCARGAKGPRAARRPNIVLCMADDQGWGDVGYNGHPALKTPHLDAMAEAGLRFDRFYAAAPVCSPTRGSVMTGRHPNRFGCFKWGHTLRPREITMAEVLRDAGYVTGHFGKWHIGSVQRGSPVTPGESGFDEWLSAPNYFDNDPILSREGDAVQMQGESSMVTAEAAIDFMRRHAGGPAPFLAVVWFGSPHRPHAAAEEDRAPYADFGETVQDFYGEITGLDRAVGRLRGALRELNVAENTLFWYCSDNGGLPEVGSTGGRGHKSEVYEGGLRVPAIIEWPAGLADARATNVPCVTSDIYPTLLELAGARVREQPPLDGVSLVPLLGGGMDARPRPIGFWDYPAKGVRTPGDQWMAELLAAQRNGTEPEDTARLFLDAGNLDTQYPEDTFPGHAAWLDWPWKLHRIQPEDADADPALELYNLADDPMEETDLAPAEPARAAAMRESLETWLASVVRSLNGADYPGGA